MRSHFHLSKVRGHSPIGRPRIALVLVDLLALRSFEQLEQRAALLRHALDVSNQEPRGNLFAEEQLQQHFIPWDLRLRRHRQPLPQSFAAFFRDGVNTPVRLSFLPLCLRTHTSVAGQPFQVWVNLAIALVPKMADRSADCQPQVVAGHGFDGQQAQ